MITLTVIAALVVILAIFLLSDTRYRFIAGPEGEVRMYVGILFLRFRVYPTMIKNIRLSNYSVKALRRARLKSQGRLKKAKKAARPEKKTPARRLTKNILYLIKIYARLARITVKKFKGRLRTDINRLAVTVATGDAAKTALVYGAACQALSYLLAVVGQGGGIRYKRNAAVGVAADFTGEKSSLELDITLRIRTANLLAIATGTAAAFLWGEPGRRERAEE